MCHLSHILCWNANAFYEWSMLLLKEKHMYKALTLMSPNRKLHHLNDDSLRYVTTLFFFFLSFYY